MLAGWIPGEFVEPFAGPDDLFGTFLRKQEIKIQSLPESTDFFTWVKSPEVISYPFATLTLYGIEGTG